MSAIPYTLEQAQADVAALRGQLDLLDEILTQSDNAVVPNNPGAGDYSQYASLGQMKYISGNDGGEYNTGINISYLTANAAAQNSNTQSSTGLSAPVGAGVNYWFEADIPLVVSASTQVFISMSGPAMTSFFAWVKYEQQGSGTAATDPLHWTVSQTVIGNNSGMSNSSGSAVAGTLWVHAQGWATPNANGNLIVSQASNGGTGFTVQKGAVLRVFPQT